MSAAEKDEITVTLFLARLDPAGEDSERRRVAERDKRRPETFLRIAEGS